jgi:hypothetical protein
MLSALDNVRRPALIFPLVAYALAMLILNLLGAVSTRAETAAASASVVSLICVDGD